MARQSFATVLNGLVLKQRPQVANGLDGFATVLNGLVLKPRILFSTRIIALPAYRSFRLDYKYFGFTQGSQITL